MPLSSNEIEQGYAEILKAALGNQRCPTTKSVDNPAGKLKSGITTKLLAAGRIRVEIYAHNYRVIEIVGGPNAGARTRAPDNKRWKPYKVLPRGP